MLGEYRDDPAYNNKWIAERCNHYKRGFVCKKPTTPNEAESEILKLPHKYVYHSDRVY